MLQSGTPLNCTYMHTYMTKQPEAWLVVFAVRYIVPRYNAHLGGNDTSAFLNQG
jgi:hypothetical protein